VRVVRQSCAYGPGVSAVRSPAMTTGQKRTAKLVGIVVGIIFLALLSLLVIEGLGIASGDEASISEVVWIVWAHQPWVVWLVSVMGAFLSGFLFGHFFAQSKSVYDEIRKGGK
jgi:hypothetical protein